VSRATLYVRFPDGTLRYGLYNGTDDEMWAPLYDTPQAAWGGYSWSPSADTGEGEPVEIATDYGGGGSWTGTATRNEVTSPADGEDNYERGLPGWAVYPGRPERIAQDL
jgi:hypothetical protein